MRTLMRRARLLVRFRTALLAALLTATAAASAYAYTDYFADGYYGAAGVVGSWHSLTRTYVHDMGGHGACANAQNQSDQSWVWSSDFCTTTDAYRDMCGCYIRRGWAGAAGAYSEYIRAHDDY